MPEFQDLTGQRFGRLTVIERAEDKIRANGRTKTVWLCRCDCGTEKTVLAESLKSGATTSCGCYNSEKAKGNFVKHGFTRNKEKERLYFVWRNMLMRCESPKNIGFCHYGGRGISVCEEWHDYAVFRKWAYENGYDDKAKSHECTIDRINNDGNYEPNNCRWADIKTQQRNSRHNRLLTFNGETKSVIEWSEQTGIPAQRLYDRLHSGWSAERALTTK